MLLTHKKDLMNTLNGTPQKSDEEVWERIPKRRRYDDSPLGIPSGFTSTFSAFPPSSSSSSSSSSTNNNSNNSYPTTPNHHHSFNSMRTSPSSSSSSSSSSLHSPPSHHTSPHGSSPNGSFSSFSHHYHQMPPSHSHSHSHSLPSLSPSSHSHPLHSHSSPPYHPQNHGLHSQFSRPSNPPDLAQIFLPQHPTTFPKVSPSSSPSSSSLSSSSSHSPPNPQMKAQFAQFMKNAQFLQSEPQHSHQSQHQHHLQQQHQQQHHHHQQHQHQQHQLHQHQQQQQQHQHHHQQQQQHHHHQHPQHQHLQLPLPHQDDILQQQLHQQRLHHQHLQQQHRHLQQQYLQQQQQEQLLLQQHHQQQHQHHQLQSQRIAQQNGLFLSASETTPKLIPPPLPSSNGNGIFSPFHTEVAKVSNLVVNDKITYKKFSELSTDSADELLEQNKDNIGLEVQRKKRPYTRKQPKAVAPTQDAPSISSSSSSSSSSSTTSSTSTPAVSTPTSLDPSPEEQEQRENQTNSMELVPKASKSYRTKKANARFAEEDQREYDPGFARINEKAVLTMMNKAVSVLEEIEYWNRDYWDSDEERAWEELDKQYPAPHFNVEEYNMRYVHAHYSQTDILGVELCRLCGSKGEATYLLFCTGCGECYHTFCLDVPSTLSAKHRREWRCPHCKMCELCDDTGHEDELFMCDECDKGYHTFCLSPPLQEVPSEHWACPSCISPEEEKEEEEKEEREEEQPVGIKVENEKESTDVEMKEQALPTEEEGKKEEKVIEDEKTKEKGDAEEERVEKGETAEKDKTEKEEQKEEIDEDTTDDEEEEEEEENGERDTMEVEEKEKNNETNHKENTNNETSTSSNNNLITPKIEQNNNNNNNNNPEPSTPPTPILLPSPPSTPPQSPKRRRGRPPKNKERDEAREKDKVRRRKEMEDRPVRSTKKKKEEDKKDPKEEKRKPAKASKKEKQVKESKGKESKGSESKGNESKGKNEEVIPAPPRKRGRPPLRAKSEGVLMNIKKKEKPDEEEYEDDKKKLKKKRGRPPLIPPASFNSFSTPPFASPENGEPEDANDSRKCSLCLKRGDSVVEGRLLPGGLDLWIHVNCILWSSEVIEAGEGALTSVYKALSRGRRVKCTDCRRYGATLGCEMAKCNVSYHFSCALANRCSFVCDEDGRCMYCPKHANQATSPFITPTKPDFSAKKYFILKAESTNSHPLIKPTSQLGKTLSQIGNDYSMITNASLRVGSLAAHSLGEVMWTRPAYHDKVEGRRQTMGESILRGSPDEAWAAVSSAINKIRENTKLAKITQHEMTGRDFFGLHHPSIVRTLEELPNSRSCLDYQRDFDFVKLRVPKIMWPGCEVPVQEEEEPIPENESGSARTEGIKKDTLRRYKKRSTVQKRGRGGGRLFALQAQNDTPAPINHFQLQQDLLQTKDVNGLPIPMQYRLLKQRLKDKKMVPLVRMGRSRIHEWGVFANMNMKESTLVLEYVGEVIRQKIADLREKLYDSKNIGCYMFRIDDESVIDATFKGNMTRFVNHCCEPNCHARIINIDGMKRILLFTKRAVAEGEELTYDYMFSYEDDESKIPCCCGAPKCRGTMN